MLRFTQRGAQFRKINEDLAIFRMGGISQTSGQRRFDEMKRAMLTNGHSYLNTAIFMGYLHIRTCIRNILNKINPDLKNLLITKKVE